MTSPRSTDTTPVRDHHEPLGPRIGAQLLADLGFLLIPADPNVPSLAYLFVALRGRPTLAHFDPEAIEYWTRLGQRCTTGSIDRATQLPIDTDLAWGEVRIVDRLGVANEYLTFGGRLEAARVDGLVVAVFSSPALLLCGAGHSDAFDPGGQSMAAFFARLRAAVGSARSLEAHACSVTPLARYGAFLADSLGRPAASEALRSLDQGTWAMLMREKRRLLRDHPDEWRSGVSLSAEVRLALGEGRALPS